MLVVTGANGFLGSYVVCALLAKGHTVRALRRSGASMAEFNSIATESFGNALETQLKALHWEEADLSDVLSLDRVFKGAEMVFHCAAVVSFKGDRKLLMKVNAEGTANVVNACLHAGVHKLVYASSTAALGRTDAQKPITEDTHWTDDANNTVYAESKHLAELEVWRGVEEGLNAVIVNPGIILGAGLWDKGSCRLFSSLHRGLRYYTRGVNGFVGVKDVAEIMCGLAFSNASAQRFLLVAENLSYQALFEMMAKGLGKKMPGIEIKPAWLPWISVFFKLNSFFNPKSNLSAETLRTALKQHHYDSSRIRTLGYTLTPIADVVAETCSLYLKQEKH